GMRNIIPDRWPAFAFVCFALFVGVGIFCVLSLMKTKRVIFSFVIIFFFIGSLFMITDANTNHDSPLFGEEVFINLIWTESEMRMYTQINATYEGVISADEHTHQRPFKVYLKSQRSIPYRILSNGSIDTELLSDSLVIWRRDSLSRPMVVRDDRYVTNMLLGNQFWGYLNNNYCCISDTHTARSYLPR
ncbi:MAG TPA: hypothetical protein PKI14_18855, partial [Fervidobacterium sp.]|nr:hypothetical protein [Fervidobacterium sp.]